MSWTIPGNALRLKAFLVGGGVIQLTDTAAAPRDAASAPIAHHVPVRILVRQAEKATALAGAPRRSREAQLPKLKSFRGRWHTGFTVGMFIGTDALTDLSSGIAQARLARLS